ncbi:FHA domain-containing isoform B [Chlorella sorokiniana]|uniref:FHA domain-containing isoform B n=1 Tax=Chlorella sorokiniana TaxID=3076 RepID=A0A2P6TNU2_CHLSO|nr:FHA domain-containing isoform B [Chlorella sorokiniana]|eukprot:PRW50993.1 FHA domain-containing isoform B [Chlorella sorokiniana]
MPSRCYEFAAALDGGVELGGMLCRDCKLWDSPDVDEAAFPLTLMLDGRGSIESFATLLAAAVPPSLTLHALVLYGMDFTAAALQGCTQLATLRTPLLDSEPHDPADVGALLGCCVGLTALRVYGDSPDQLEALVAQPPPQLRSLELCDARALPPQLALLTSLECLDCTWSFTVELSLEDVELLSRLPQLRTLRLSQHTNERSAARVLRALRRRLPSLEVL